MSGNGGPIGAVGDCVVEWADEDRIGHSGSVVVCGHGEEMRVIGMGDKGTCGRPFVPSKQKKTPNKYEAPNVFPSAVHRHYCPNAAN